MHPTIYRMTVVIVVYEWFSGDIPTVSMAFVSYYQQTLNFHWVNQQEKTQLNKQNCFMMSYNVGPASYKMLQVARVKPS